MTTIERHAEKTVAQDIAVTIVDTDVHPLPVSAEVLKSYAPAEWMDRIWPTGNAVSPVPHFYDTPDSYKTKSLRVDASSAERRCRRQRSRLRRQTAAGRRRREHRCAGADVRRAAAAGRARPEGDLQRLAGRRLARREQLARPLARRDQRHARRIPVKRRAKIERWAGHPYMAEVLMTPQTRGIPFGSPHFDPLYEAAVAQRASGRHPPDGADAVRADPDLSGRQPRALARLLRVVAAAVRVASDEPGVRRRVRPASRSAGGVRRGRLHVGDAGDVADGPDLGAPQGRSAARASQAVGVCARTRAVHHPAAGGRQRRASTASTSR